MRKFMAVATLAVLGGLGLPDSADAQVIGTRGAMMPGGGVPMQGYYSPYPGVIYSPYRQAPVYLGGSPAFAGGPAFQHTYVAPDYYGNGFTVTRFGNYGYHRNYGTYGYYGYPRPNSAFVGGQAFRRW